MTSERTLRDRRSTPKRAGYSWCDTALPDEIELRIFEFLPRSAVLKVAAVSKAWNARADAPALWRLLAAREWEGKFVQAEYRAQLSVDPKGARAPPLQAPAGYFYARHVFRARIC